MPSYQATRRVPYRASDIYKVVADVGHYQEFLPLVESSVVKNSVTTDEITRFHAELKVGYASFHIRESFSSEVEANAQAMTVSSQSTGQAIRKLQALWKIRALTEKTCEISFSVEYEMKSMMLQLILSRLFDQAVNRIMLAFERRAAALYQS